jgi:sec-independent protein translocase protein TatA
VARRESLHCKGSERYDESLLLLGYKELIMGLHGMSFGSLLLIFLIVALLFGTKRLRNVGEDLGAAFRGLRKGIKEDQGKDDQQQGQ